MTPSPWPSPVKLGATMLVATCGISCAPRALGHDCMFDSLPESVRKPIHALIGLASAYLIIGAVMTYGGTCSVGIGGAGFCKNFSIDKYIALGTLAIVAGLSYYSM